MNCWCTEPFRLPEYDKWSALLIATCLFVTPSQATTLVVVVTKHGIVMAADGKAVTLHPNQRIPNGTSVVRKIRLAQGRIIWGAAGLERAANGKVVAYDFNRFSDAVETRIPPGASILEASELIREELARAFAGFDVMLRSGTFTPEDAKSGNGLIRYFIAGYEAGAPKVFRIDIDIDWGNKHLEEPKLIPVYPGGCQRKNLSTCGAGPDIFKTLKDTRSIYFKWAVYRTPLEMHGLLNDRDISLQQSLRLARVLVEVGIEFDASAVGMPITAIAITPNGSHRAFVYHERLTDVCAHK